MGKEVLTRLQRFKNTLKLMTVEPYLFFCLFGYTVRMVTYQNLLMDRGCRNILNYGDEICDHLELKVHKPEKTKSISAGNDLYMGIMLMSSVPAMIVAVFLGPWSDKYSRKYPMIIAAAGMMLESIASAVLAAYPGINPIWFVLVCIFDGLTGGFIISNSSAFSYLSDITDERSRPSRFAVLEFFNIASIVVGNVLGGQVFEALQSKAYVPVMSMAPVCFCCAVLYAIFCVKETKPPVPAENRMQMFRDLVRIDNLKQSYITCSKKRPGNIRLQIWLLVWISCCQRFTDMGILAVGYPFAKGVYGWSVTQFSNASVAFYVVNALVTLLVIPLLCNHFRLHEAALGLIGMLSLLAKMTLCSVAIMPALFYYSWMSGTLANCAGIAVRSRLSKLVNKEELGRAFSLLGTCESSTPVLGSVIFLQLYNATAEFFPGFAFAVSAIFLIPCAVIFYWMMRMPTISLGEYAVRDEMKTAKALEAMPSTSNYSKLEEEKY